MNILITGGCGFIGHHVVEHFLKNTDSTIIVLDKLTYASEGFDRLRDINVYDSKRVKILTVDFIHPLSPGIKKEIGEVDYILHLGAETHVDRSIQDAEPFVLTNVLGTLRMLDFAREQKNLKWFVYFSTDEVFGPAPKGTAFLEWDRYYSSNPYAATKAGGEELCLSYANTHKLPVIITHTMNCFGERQNPEKFIPSTIRKILRNETVIIHSDPTKTISGSRFYIHCRNVASALLFLLNYNEKNKDAQIKSPGKFNIVGEKEVSNLELARFIAKVLEKPLIHEMADFHSSRPGHDLRYALNGKTMYNLGWRLPINFEDGFTKTIKWSLENLKWLGLEK